MCLSHSARRISLLMTLFAFSLPSYGAVVFSLTENGCSVGCNVLPAGTVTIVQNLIDDVLVTVQLDPNYSFRGPNDANHHSFVFNIAGSVAITVSGITSGDIDPQTWVLNAGAFNDTPFGTFEYELDCVTCTPGMGGATTRNLSFHVLGAGVTELSFIPTGLIYFAVDVVGQTALAGLAQTGNIGALQGTVVPEPSSVLMLSSALGGLWALARRRRRDSAQ